VDHCGRKPGEANREEEHSMKSFFAGHRRQVFIVTLPLPVLSAPFTSQGRQQQH